MTAKMKFCITLRRILFKGTILVCFAGIVGNAFSGWKRIGFAGTEVTAITAGIDKLAHDSLVILVAAGDSGIYSISGLNDSIRRFPRFALNASDKPAGIVRSLYVDDDGVAAFAGTDSGLYGESMNFSSLPAWKKISAFHGEPVVGITRKDTAYCAATIKELYTSKSPFGTWKPCSVSKYLPPTANGAHFTSLTWWRYGGFAAGSALSGESNDFGGVMLSGDKGSTWNNVTCVVNQCVHNDVYSLSGDYNGRLYAGTSRGIFWAIEFDTGQWYEVSPQLTTVAIRHQWITYDSVSRQREIFASTDSGVYLLSSRSNPQAWTLSLKIKAFGVWSSTTNTPQAWFAATSDGVWKYEQQTTALRSSNVHSELSFHCGMSEAYSIDGRLLPSQTRLNRISGVYILRQQRVKGSPAELTIRFNKR